MMRSSAARILAAGMCAFAAVAGGGAAVASDQPSTTLRISVEGTPDSLDPAIADVTWTWQLEYATCAKLVTYPDAAGPGADAVVPEVSQALPDVAPDGLTYTFHLRGGFAFPSGEAVDAGTFKHTIERALSPQIDGPAQGLVPDIAGEEAFIAGTASTITGIQASGETLTITLTSPSPTFLARLAAPFFCAVPGATPFAPARDGLPTAGPYSIASTANGQITLAENPFYPGPRSHRWAAIVYTTNSDPAAATAAITQASPTSDYLATGVPAAQAADLMARFGPGSPAAGAGHQQLFLGTQPALVFLALNTSRPPFDDVTWRQAVNFALDRPALLGAAGPGAGIATDQYIPSGLDGFRDVSIYPVGGPDLAMARSLAAGRTATVMLYTGNGPVALARAQIITADLGAIGLSVHTQSFPAGELYTRLGTRGEPFDLGLGGWAADYPDPADFINTLLDGSNLQPTNNTDWSYFHDPAFEARMHAADALTGAARSDAYASLDADLVRQAAPLASIAEATSRDLVSSLVGCVTEQPVYGLDVAALCPVAATTPPAKKKSPPDTTPPVIRLSRIGHQSLRNALRHGLRMRAACSEACTLVISAYTGPLPPLRRLMGMPRPVASARASLDTAGSSVVRLRFTRVARARLAHRRHVRLRIREIARDAAGNTAVLVVRVRL